MYNGDFQFTSDDDTKRILTENTAESPYASEEVDVEMFPANDMYPISNETVGVSDEANGEIIPANDNEEIEVSRGALSVLTNDFFLPPCSDIILTETVEEESEECKKTRVFIESIKVDGAWARSLYAVRLAVNHNPYLTKDVVSDLLTFCIMKVNNRPRSLTLSSKNVTLEDIAGLIKLSFAIKDDEHAMNNSLLRLYCKNTTKRLKDLAKVLTSTCSQLDDIRVSYGDVFAELRQSSSVIRYRTSDISKYLTLEHCIQDINMRVLTSFKIRKRDDNSREINVSWFDEIKEGFGRVSYIHFDHIANCQTTSRVTFGETTCQEFVVDKNTPMSTVANLNHPVHDLIQFLTKLDSPKYQL